MTDHPEWLANIEPVLKEDGQVRMCIDYRDLYKASPKDSFPLSHIDVLVDNTTSHTYSLSWTISPIIRMSEDQWKTSFITL